MGGLFSSPKAKDPGPDPEIARLKAEEARRIAEQEATQKQRKKKLMSGLYGGKSLLTGGYKGYRSTLGYEEQDFA